jgi:hypothetical protein
VRTSGVSVSLDGGLLLLEGGPWASSVLRSSSVGPISTLDSSSLCKRKRRPHPTRERRDGS